MRGLAIFNMIPRSFGGVMGTHHSDAYWLLKIPFLRDSSLLEFEKSKLIYEAHMHHEKGNTEAAIKIYEQFLRDDPEDELSRFNLAVVRLRFGSFEKSREVFTSLLNSKEFNKPVFRSLLVNSIAWVNAILGDEVLLDEASALSIEAYRSNPKSVFFASTRGAVLIRQSQFREGLIFLNSALKKASDNNHLACIHCFIAMAYARMGEQKKSEFNIKKADEYDHLNALNSKVKIEMREVFSQPDMR